jgi:hypothetical protein
MLNKLTQFWFKNAQLSGKIVFTLALIVSFVFRIIFPNTFHHYDVTTFVEWGNSVNPFREVYLTSCFCNYPILGMFLSTGILKLLDFNVFYFLIFLCFIDSINVLLCYLIMRLIKIPNSLFWSGLIGLSFSSWIGGAQWGQIDNIGQLFILTLLILIYFFIQTDFKQKNSINLLIIPIGLLISILILTKQLLIFPVAIILIFLFCFLFVYSSKIQFFTYLLTLICVIIFPIFLFDWWLYIPEKYIFSHFEKIFSEGSEHINSISGNGFNIWMLFYNDQNSSATDTIFLNMSPKNIGLFLFLIVNFWTIYLSFNFVKKMKENLDKKSIFVFLLGLFSFYNLAFNLVLTGTHERYLYHFYPYLILFFLYLFYYRKNDLKFVHFDLILAIIGSLIYGFFVFCILKKYLDSISFHRFLLLFHLLLIWRINVNLIQLQSQKVTKHLS